MDGCRRLSEVLPPDSEAIYVLPRDFVHPAKRYPLFFFLVLFFPYMWLSDSFLDSIVAASHSCFHKARKAMAEGELSNGRGADRNVSIECLPESVTDISTTVAFVCPWFSTFLSTFYCMDLFGMLLGGLGQGLHGSTDLDSVMRYAHARGCRVTRCLAMAGLGLHSGHLRMLEETRYYL